MPKKTVRSNPPMYEDLTTRQQTGLGKEMNRIGRSVVERTVQSRDEYRRASSDSANGADYRSKSASRERSMDIIAPAVQNRPITMRTASQARQGLVGRARDEALSETQRTGRMQPLPGAGWYFKHHADIMAGAQGTDPTRAIAAASAMSPGKDPDTDEVPNAHALMHLHQNDSPITQVDNGRSTTRRFSSIPSDEAAGLMSRAASENQAVQAGKQQPTVSSSDPLANVSNAGRAHEPNVAKAIKVLRGEISPEAAVTGPKVTSYSLATQHSIPGSAEHVDWQNMSQHYVHGNPDQGMFMFSKRGPGAILPSSALSPNHVTAEDTWMHSITSGQDAKYKPERGRAVSPAKRVVDKGGPAEFSGLINQKVVGTAGDKSIDRTGLTYAFNNKATRQASENTVITHDQHGESVHMPSIMTQEVSWTQQRREAGADAPYNKTVRERTGGATRIAPRTSSESTGDPEMFTHSDGTEWPNAPQRERRIPGFANKAEHEAWLDKNDNF